MRVYCAAPWEFKNETQAVAQTLEAKGITVTHRWWEQPDTDDASILRRHASADLRGVQDCDLLVVLALKKSEGKATEMGYALAYGKPIIVYQPPNQPHRSSNVFYYHPRVRIVHELSSLVYLITCELEGIHAAATV